MSFCNLVVSAAEHLTPYSLLSSAGGFLARARLGPLSRLLIRGFAKTYKIDLSECARPDISSYSSFGDFFARELKEDARPVAQDCAGIFPCDGTVTQTGDVIHGRLIQAKGVDYGLRTLLGGDQKDCDHFESGGFITIYLSPRNYHRVHMPLDGSLVKTVHIPGRRFPVGARSVACIPGLYTRNERLVCLFDTELGRFAVILVGAAMVGSIHTQWQGFLKGSSDLTINHFDPDQHTFERGAEIAYFAYGSTVICLWPEHSCSTANWIDTGAKVQVGQKMLF